MTGSWDECCWQVGETLLQLPGHDLGLDCGLPAIFNRHCEAGAVLETGLLMINQIFYSLLGVRDK